MDTAKLTGPSSGGILRLEWFDSTGKPFAGVTELRGLPVWTANTPGFRLTPMDNGLSCKVESANGQVVMTGTVTCTATMTFQNGPMEPTTFTAEAEIELYPDGWPVKMALAWK